VKFVVKEFDEVAQIRDLACIRNAREAYLEANMRFYLICELLVIHEFEVI